MSPTLPPSFSVASHPCCETVNHLVRERNQWQSKTMADIEIHATGARKRPQLVDAEAFLKNMTALLEMERDAENEESSVALNALAIPGASERKQKKGNGKHAPPTGQELARNKRALEAAGRALTGMRAMEEYVGHAVGGSPTITLTRKDPSVPSGTGATGVRRPLNRSGISSGDAVAIVSSRKGGANVTNKKSEEGLVHELRGVVASVTGERMVVVLNGSELPSPDEMGFALFDASLVILKLSDDVTFHRLSRALLATEQMLLEGSNDRESAMPAMDVMFGRRYVHL